VTLRWIQGEGVLPRVQPPQTTVDAFKTDVKNQLAGIMDRLSRLQITVNQAQKAASPRKGDLARIAQELIMVKQELASNLPFVADQFNESMENSMTEARQEIEAWFQAEITRRGLAAGTMAPISLSSGDEEQAQ
jgi:hypothetical protein